MVLDKNAYTPPAWDESKEPYDHPKRRAGVLVINPRRRTVLLVQSRCKFWGVPKGGIEHSETPIQCAVRELYEEANMRVAPSDLKLIVESRTDSYFLYKSDYESGQLPPRDPLHYNDATGFAWVKFECLVKMLRAKKLVVNGSFRFILRSYFSVQIEK